MRETATPEENLAVASAREEFASEVADGIDEESLCEHEVAERVLAAEETEVTTESCIHAVERVRAARA